MIREVESLNQANPDKNSWVLELNDYQTEFLDSIVRYPAMVSAVGTGKTMMGLMKVWKYCDEYPGSLWLVVRKEWVDLRDSTVRDFQDYFGVTLNSDKDYVFPNGSVIMFRHGGEISKAQSGQPNILKNINLSSS